VRLIGVGVGSGITANSNWLADPGAGYRYAWERAYRRYQKGAGAYESNVDFEQAAGWRSNVDFIRWDGRRWRDTGPTEYYANNSNGSWTDGWYINGTRGWYNIDQSEYDNFRSLHPGGMVISNWTDASPEEYFANNVDNGAADGWRINDTRSWYPVSEALYLANNSNSGSGDGWRTTSTWLWVTKAEYDANNTTPDGSDGWVDTGSNEYVSAWQATDWIEWTGSRPGSSDQYRSTKVYNSPPYDGFEDPVTASTRNDMILARLIAGNDHGVPAIWDGEYYTNAEIADMYVQIGRASCRERV
jgi:hypothetical protein